MPASFPDSHEGGEDLVGREDLVGSENPEGSENLEGRDGLPGAQDGGVPAGSGPGRETDPAMRADLGRAFPFLDAQIGVPADLLGPLSWLRRGTNLWAHTLDAWPLRAWKPGGHWRVVAVGFRAFDLGGDGPPRPTNDLLGWLADRVPRRVELSATQWLSLLEERSLPHAGPDGMVALAHGGTVLARGYRRDGVLRHEVPKGRRRWLASVMEGRRDAG